MPIRGRKPKPEGERRNRSKLAHDWTEIEDVPFEDGPRLPRIQPNKLPWPAPTKKWWATISTMAHCVLWLDSDWQFALDTAILVAAFHSGELKYARELRQREKVMGMTADALRDLRIKYVAPGASEGEPAALQSISDYKKRLTRR